jgi:hypothetical protein
LCNKQLIIDEQVFKIPFHCNLIKFFDLREKIILIGSISVVGPILRPGKFPRNLLLFNEIALLSPDEVKLNF